MTAAATSADSTYAGLSAADALVTNADNDNAGITVTAATTPLTTTEAGGTATFTVGAEHTTDGQRDDGAQLEQPGRRNGPSDEPGLYERELERGADRDGDGRGRSRWPTGRSPTRL